MTDTPNLGMPLVSEGQASADITHNEAIIILDIVAQPRVFDRDLGSPPASPSEGDRYIVGSPASGDWTSNENNIAYFLNNIWQFLTPQDGWKTWVEDEGVEVQYDSGTGTWELAAGFGAVGSPLLLGRVSSTGSIIEQSSPIGATFSVATIPGGIYDLTFSGIPAGPVYVDAVSNQSPNTNRGEGNTSGRITASGFAGSAQSFPTNTGARINMIYHNQEQQCGGCDISRPAGADQAFTFQVVRM